MNAINVRRFHKANPCSCKEEHQALMSGDREDRYAYSWYNDHGSCQFCTFLGFDEVKPYIKRTKATLVNAYVTTPVDNHDWGIDSLFYIHQFMRDENHWEPIDYYSLNTRKHRREFRARMLEQVASYLKPLRDSASNSIDPFVDDEDLPF